MRSPILLAASAVLLLAVAAPAAADAELMNGDYRIRLDGSDYGVWAFSPHCDVPADGCTARVVARPKGWTLTGSEATLRGALKLVKA